MNRAAGKGDTDEEKAFQKALIPSKEQVRTLVGSTLKGVMIPPDAVDAISEYVMAYYIGNKIRTEGGGTNTKLTGADTDAIANRKAFTEAIETVLGKPSKVNGSNVLRPWGMTDGDFQARTKSLIEQNYPDMESAGLLNVNGSGKYELLEGGVPTGKFIDVSRADTNYGIEGNKPRILTQRGKDIEAAEARAPGFLQAMSGGTMSKGGATNPPTAQQVYAGVGIK
jgi:hypothetical protein